MNGNMNLVPGIFLVVSVAFQVLTEENEEFKGKRSCPGKEIIQDEIHRCINTREENLRHAGKNHSEEVFCGIYYYFVRCTVLTMWGSTDRKVATILADPSLRALVTEMFATTKRCESVIGTIEDYFNTDSKK